VTSPLIGEPVTFAHFEFKVSASDQYGRRRADEIDGVVTCDSDGRFEHLVIGGKRASGDDLRRLRQEIKRTHKWPTHFDRKPSFGPDADPNEIALRTTQPLRDFLGVQGRVVRMKFPAVNPVGEPDGTWHMQIRASDNALITARLEPFLGKVIEVDICRDSDCWWSRLEAA
jgi:hypothetical protein